MRRTGFTLVEMLVATALVVLMMLLFAQVFQVAGRLVSNQKGMAEQDQNVRTMTILLRGDISQRTFKRVEPFSPAADPSEVVPYDSFKRGFFSISENDHENATDDVLHLTIQVDEDEDSPLLPFAGRAALLREPGNPVDADIDTLSEAELYLLGDTANPANNNQPEFDDGQRSINGTGSSRFAEVCWFLRNGTLYRRSSLIRESYAETTATDSQPTNANGDRFVPGDYSAANVPPAASWHSASGEFWRDFDYSAYYEPTGGLRFHNVDSLANTSGDTAALNPNLRGVPASLGIPFLRFGSSTSRATTGPLTIQGPREFLTPGDWSTFIGRFTHQETSHSDFDYPGNLNGGDPFDDGTALTLANGAVSEYSTELSRRGEDIVMTNVHSFDIQVWDDPLARFVNLGHGEATGDYRATANTTYGNRYDTWHPNSLMPTPPYRPLNTDGTAKPLRAIQILIRFFDVNSDSMRDLTFTFSLDK